jgi:hypothetical protein
MMLIGTLVTPIVAAEIKPEETESKPSRDIARLEIRMKRLCEQLWRRIDASRQASRRESAARAVRREVDEFFKRFKKSAPAFDIVRILARLGREVIEIGEDGDTLRSVVTHLQQKIEQFRDRGESMVDGDYWKRWSTALWKVRENPLRPEIAKFEELEIDESVFTAGKADEPDTGSGAKGKSGSNEP